MIRRARTLSIDHRDVPYPEGATVLRAAELAGIDIPHLCCHPLLAPYGGCRLCAVEIDGMRGYPLACTTLAEPGLKVLTDTGPLRELRREVLQLILSEHPSSCLACDERVTCALAQTTIRKSGVPTGCRFCPADQQCELQALVEKLGIEDLEYPIRYKGLEPEHDDPFFDRDYNLCILCGRCVRMCQDVRLAGVLAFVNRGSETTIGTAFGASHVEAGCEFCGACVSVCPTGALWEKGARWDGKPDGVEVSTCPFCSVGCQLDLHHRHGRLSCVDGHPDSEINDGQLCVRGRFCLPEATHHHERLRRPHLRRDPYFRQVTWDVALDEVTERLREVAPGDFLMLASGDLTNEGIFAAQRFVREDLGSPGIDTTARRAYGSPELAAALLGHPISIHGVGDSDAVLVIGLDRKFSLSVLGVRVRQATEREAVLVVVSANDSDLARDADQWLRPRFGSEASVLADLARRVDGEQARRGPRGTGLTAGDLKEAAGLLASARRLSVVIGPQVFALGEEDRIREACARLHSLDGIEVNVVPVAFGGNLRGALELGGFPELLPGGGPAPARGHRLEDLESGHSRPRVLYLVGEAPFLERPDVEYVIAQDLFPPPFEVDAFFPAASFAEAGGTLTNLEGRVQEVRAVESGADRSPDGPRPDWAVFAELASRLGRRKARPRSWRAVLRDISEAVPGFPHRPDRRARPLGFRVPAPPPRRPAAARRPQDGEFLLVGRPAGFRHRSVDLSSKVEGLYELGFEEGLVMNPHDLDQLGVRPGERVAVTPRGAEEARGPVRPEESCPEGVVQFWRPDAFGGLNHRAPLAPLYRLGRTPVPASVVSAGSEG